MKIDEQGNPNYLNDFIFYLRIILGRSERTISEYYLDIRLFLRYIKIRNCNLTAKTNSELEAIPISDIPVEWLAKVTLNDMYSFLNFVSTERANTPATRARKASSIKVFYKYLSTNAHLIGKNPVKDLEMPAIKKAMPRYLTLEQSLKLLKCINSDNLPRDYCIITLFLNCGMRLSELVGLNIQDIHFEERTMRLLGKGNKERIIFLNAACVEVLKDYLDVRPKIPQEPNALFLSKFHKRISKRRVQQIVEGCLQAAGLDHQGLSTHKLRHTAATLMYQYGEADPLVLKEILGHKSIATTEIYTHVADEQMKKAADHSPLAKIHSHTPKKEPDQTEK